MLIKYYRYWHLNYKLIKLCRSRLIPRDRNICRQSLLLLKASKNCLSRLLMSRFWSRLLKSRGILGINYRPSVLVSPIKHLNWRGIRRRTSLVFKNTVATTLLAKHAPHWNWVESKKVDSGSPKPGFTVLTMKNRTGGNSLKRPMAFTGR